MKDIPYGYVAIASIISITILESINMVTFKHNGNVLSLCLILVAGLGGYTIKYMENVIREKYGKK